MWTFQVKDQPDITYTIVEVDRDQARDEISVEVKQVIGYPTICWHVGGGIYEFWPKPADNVILINSDQSVPRIFST